jgi:hypothetical protein
METRIIEINGIKVEVDLRTAKRVDQFKVGDRVKCLVKEYSKYSVYPGVIIGFEDFKTLPTLIIAYLKLEYSGSSLVFLNINAETEDVEIVPADDEYLPIEKGDVVGNFDTEIRRKQAEVEDLERKKAYFLKRFNQYFKDVAEE